MQLIKYCDVALLGRDYAEFMGYKNMLEGVHKLKEMTMTLDEYKNENIKYIICPWGKNGAGVIFDSHYVEAKAYPVEKIVDSLGAGDTFCGALLYALNKDFSNIREAIDFACKVAAHKIGFNGYDCVKDLRL